MRRTAAAPDPARFPALIRPRSSLLKPIVSPPDEENRASRETIIPEQTIRHILPELRRADTQGLMENPLNEVIY